MSGSVFHYTLPRFLVLRSAVIVSITHQRHFLHQHSQCVVELQYVCCLTLLQHRSSAGPNIMIGASCYLSQIDVPSVRTASFKEDVKNSVRDAREWRWRWLVPPPLFGIVNSGVDRFLTRNPYHTDSVFLQDPLIRGVHQHNGVHSEQGEDPVPKGRRNIRNQER